MASSSGKRHTASMPDRCSPRWRGVPSAVKLGTLLTPLPWRRPWKVASQVATVDELSGGRAILTVGLGAVVTDLPLTGEELDRDVRARR